MVEPTITSPFLLEATMKPNPKPDTERDALIEEHLQKLRERLKEQLPDDQATLDQIEEAVGRLGREMTQDLQHRLLNRRSKQGRDNRIECSCGGVARYKGQQPRTLVSAHGLLKFKRPCYHCPTCQRTLAPLDEALGLDVGVTTRQVRVWASFLSAQLPFAQAATTLQLLTRVALSAATLQRISVAVGSSLRNQQHQQAKQHQTNTLPDQRTRCPRRLYIGMDGLFVPLRDPWKKDGSQGELTCRFGECKSAVVYETAEDHNGKDTRVKTHAYTATLQGVDAFAPLVATLAHQSGHHAAKECAVIGDGAPWIWQIANLYFPGALQIVDFFHACQHLCELAEARFGKDSPQGKEWQQARQTELKTNRLQAVLAEIGAWKPTHQAKRDLRRRTYAYFAHNAERMRYQTFLEKGYHIGSGVVEATCKRVVAQRLDEAGMHWRPETAEAVVTLRAALLSTFPPDLREHCAMPT
jgi:hypothetical protein